MKIVSVIAHTNTLTRQNLSCLLEMHSCSWGRKSEFQSLLVGTLKEQPPLLRSQELRHIRFVSTPKTRPSRAIHKDKLWVGVGGSSGDAICRGCQPRASCRLKSDTGILGQPPVSHIHSDSGSTRPGLTLLKIWLTKEADWPPSSPRGPPSLLPGTGIASACRDTQLLMWVLGVTARA